MPLCLGLELVQYLDLEYMLLNNLFGIFCIFFKSLFYHAYLGCFDVNLYSVCSSCSLSISGLFLCVIVLIGMSGLTLAHLCREKSVTNASQTTNKQTDRKQTALLCARIWQTCLRSFGWGMAAVNRRRPLINQKSFIFNLALECNYRLFLRLEEGAWISDQLPVCQYEHRLIFIVNRGKLFLNQKRPKHI